MAVLSHIAPRRNFLGQLAALLLVGWRSPVSSPLADDDLRSLMPRIMHAWDDLNPAAAARYYAKDPNLVFYDDAPLKYVGWEAYARGVKKEFAGYKSFATTLNDDIDVHRLGGTFAWGTATWRANGVKRDDSTEIVDGRWTVCFEKRDGKWLIVHEHVSVPTP
jgi:ketosteroid isomerase-like protein